MKKRDRIAKKRRKALRRNFEAFYAGYVRGYCARDSGYDANTREVEQIHGRYVDGVGLDGGKEEDDFVGYSNALARILKSEELYDMFVDLFKLQFEHVLRPWTEVLIGRKK